VARVTDDDDVEKQLAAMLPEQFEVSAGDVCRQRSSPGHRRHLSGRKLARQRRIELMELNAGLPQSRQHDGVARIRRVVGAEVG